MFRTRIAGVALLLGTSVAFGQTQTAPPADVAQPPAEEATETDETNADADAAAAGAAGQTQTAPPADAAQPPAEEATTTETDAEANADADAAAAGAVVAGSAGAAVAADAQATQDTPASDEELAAQQRAEKKARRKADCEKINVGKPRDC